MELRDYLRDEILEEAELGYLSQQERDRRLAVFDSGGNVSQNAATSPAKQQDGHQPFVDPSDPTISIRQETLKDPKGDLLIYCAKPHGNGQYPGVIVVHENKGLVPYVEDVARRLAKQGFFAIAPDLLSRRGGTSSFSDPAEATTALGTIDRNDMISDLMSAVDYLENSHEVDAKKIGAIGFCFGGGMVWQLITKDKRVKAAVPFYGPNPPLEDVQEIAAKVLAIYGALDDRINAGIPKIEEAMTSSGKTFEKLIYQDAQHAFHNDTNPDRYNQRAAEDAWTQATSWLDRWLA